MPLRNFFEGLGEFIDWTFGILTTLGNLPNYFFMIVIAGFVGYWFSQMVKQKRAGEN